LHCAASDQGEDASRVENVHPLPAEQLFQIEVPGLQHCGGSVGPIVGGRGGYDTGAVVGEVHAIVKSALVVGRIAAAVDFRVPPADPARIHAGFPQLVADILPDRIIHQGGEHGGAQPESVGQPTGHIGFSPALEHANTVAHTGRSCSSTCLITESV